ncbi:dihydrodipicolinate synthase family protein [Bauldia sp.]|uniref:dihydrodipicolinate synthase family protein n=1 Tax=Bauldia sp. TaxID=2575872 RepID=UPI003BAC970A
MSELQLPTADGILEPFRFGDASPFPATADGVFNRVSFAAAHVVSDPLTDNDPWLDAAIDWDTTIAYRRHLWGLGFSVAEAMDTAQRGMGLDWPNALELIRRATDAAKADGHRKLAAGVGTDHLDPTNARTVNDVIAAYETQMEAVEAAGAPIILMASRALAKVAKSADDYRTVYGRLLGQAREPVILHWLGAMFDPALAGYWGTDDIPTAMAIALDVIAAHPDKVDGIKISLLEERWEVEMRRQLPVGVRMYTGDDFNFADLIFGDEQGHSDALLGIFDAIAPAAAAALAKLAADDEAGFRAALEPTVPLSRLIFEAPTRFYKTGIVFLAWLNGHQDHFTMVGGQESARSVIHLSAVARLADAAGLIVDPDAATARLKTYLALHGIA